MKLILYNIKLYKCLKKKNEIGDFILLQMVLWNEIDSLLKNNAEY